MTITEAFDTYRQHVTLTTRAACSAASDLRRWIAHGGEPDVHRIGMSEFGQFRAVTQQRYSADTIENTVSTVLRVLRMLERLGLLPRVPWGGPALKKRVLPRNVPTLAQVSSLYQHADAATWPLFCRPGDYWRAMLVLGYYTCLRLGDLQHRLHWSGVMSDSLMTTASKTGKAAAWPMHSVVKRHLTTLPRRGDAVLGAPASNKQRDRALHEINDAAGLERHVTMQGVRKRGITSWELAKTGAGSVVQGSAVTGSALHYVEQGIVPRILIEAVEYLEWPAAMLLPEDRKPDDETKMLRLWRRMRAQERAALLGVAERMGA